MTDIGRVPSGQALVASDEAQLHGLHPSGFDPSRLAMAELLCRSRADAQAGYFCKPGEGFEAALRYGKRWAPMLGRELVSLERHVYYATRAEAVEAAREWRSLWRAKLAAIAMEAAPAGETAQHGSTRSATARAEGIAPKGHP